MKRITELFKRMTLGFLLAAVPMLGGCGDNTQTCQEEVKLLDGRVTVITKKYGFQRGVFRESWITLKLPETDNQETIWHEHLMPENLNVVSGKLYIVGIPWTDVEYLMYDKPSPEYIGYVFENNAWRRIPFNEIPVAMYDMNVLTNAPDPDLPRLITLDEKNKLFADPRRAKDGVRINPAERNPNEAAYRNYNKHD